MYRVEWKPSAARAFRSLPRQVQERIAAKVDVLADDPRGSGLEKLTGSDNRHRLRVGDYRVIYDIQDTVLLVLVVAVGHRREVYRRSR